MIWSVKNAIRLLHLTVFLKGKGACDVSFANLRVAEFASQMVVSLYKQCE